METEQAVAPVESAPKVPNPLTDAGPMGAETEKRSLDSVKFAALARREKELVNRDLELKRRQQEYDEKFKQYDSKFKEYEEFQGWKSKAKLDPIKALDSLGLSYEDITNHIINNNKPTVETELEILKRQMRERDEALTRREKEKEERLKAEEQERANKVLESFKQEINDYIDTNKDKFEFIDLYDARDLVFKTISEHYETTQKVLSNEEACNLVEDYLYGLFEKGTATKRYSAKALSQPKESTAKLDGEQAKTLTNSLSANAGTSMLPAKTERERTERALAALSKMK